MTVKCTSIILMVKLLPFEQMLSGVSLRETQNIFVETINKVMLCQQALQLFLIQIR